MAGKNHINTPPPETDKITVQKELPVALGHAEIEAIGKDLADTTSRLSEVAQQKRDANSSFNKSIKDLGGHAIKLAEMIHNKNQTAMVECEILYNYTSGEKTTTRMDTLESWNETMTAMEMQRSFPDMTPTDEEAAPPAEGENAPSDEEDGDAVSLGLDAEEGSEAAL